MIIKLITLESFYILVGAILGLVGLRCASDRQHPKRWGSTVFWCLLGVIFAGGKWLPPLVVGYGVLALVLLAATRQIGASPESGATRTEKIAEAERLGNRLLWPTLLIPATAVAGSLLLPHVHLGGIYLIDPKQATLISVGIGAIFALSVARELTGAAAATPMREGGRLLQALGWALILPQLLAALGGVFAQAGVGPVVADVVARTLPTHIPLVAIVAYCVGMAVFTICMGNAFAAFAVITGGIGLPLIVQQHHGNPAIMAAIGMLSGYCGTLVTPMAANFNIVPAMLLELRDQNAVIKAQAPMAAVILIANILLMWACVYRF
jgi:uncharacterized membrane protein